MLSEISAKNIALLENIRISFTSGFNVITGETGAGKSILIESLKLALGEKLPPSMVPGEGTGSVEILYLPGELERGTSYVKELDLEENKELIMRRSVSSSGRSRIYLNDSRVTAPLVSELTSELVSILGQHGLQRLFGSKNALRLYDGYCGNRELNENYTREYRRFRKIVREFEDAREETPSLKGKRAWLEEGIRELKPLSLTASEEKEIEKELPLLKNGAKIKDTLQEVLAILDQGERSALSMLKDAADTFKRVSRIDPSLEEIEKDLERHLYSLSDLSRDILSRFSEIDLDEERYEELMARLSLIRRLSRKYGVDPSALPGKLKDLEAELEGIDRASERMARLQLKVLKKREEVSAIAGELSERRKKMVRPFEKSVEKELGELGMKGSRFHVSLLPEKKGELSLYGFEKVEFLFSPDSSVDVGPLTEVASGGELSRIMLSVHSTLVTKGRFGTLVFDEVDAGIGGKMAEKVGEKLKNLSISSQVICITHLPQIAALADHHIKIVKEGGTHTRAHVLLREERVEEIARMVSGEKISEEAVHYAEMLLER